MHNAVPSLTRLSPHERLPPDPWHCWSDPAVDVHYTSVDFLVPPPPLVPRRPHATCHPSPSPPLHRQKKKTATFTCPENKGIRRWKSDLTQCSYNLNQGVQVSGGPPEQGVVGGGGEVGVGRDGCMSHSRLLQSTFVIKSMAWPFGRNILSTIVVFCKVFSAVGLTTNWYNLQRWLGKAGAFSYASSVGQNIKVGHKREVFAGSNIHSELEREKEHLPTFVPQ